MSLNAKPLPPNSQGLANITWKKGLSSDDLAATSRTVVAANVEGQATKPPPPYDQGSLVAAMQNVSRLIENPQLREMLKDAGIGTPATRAPMIAGQLAAGNLVEDKKTKALSVSEKSEALLSIVPPEFKSPEQTAIWESFLSKIAATGDNVLFDKFYAGIVTKTQQLHANLSVKRLTLPGAVELAASQSCEIVQCSKGGSLQQAQGKFGLYWKCETCGDFFNDRNGVPERKQARQDVAPLADDGKPCGVCKKGTLKTLPAKEGKRFLKCQNEKCGKGVFPEEGGWEARRSK